MITSGIIWRMALKNLRNSWKQTLLTILAGSIGAMLIAISAVNYESVKHSGDDWLERRLGPIGWKLVPDGAAAEGFSADDIEEMNKSTTTYTEKFMLLPYVMTETTLLAKDPSSGEERAVLSQLLMGFSMETATELDPEGAALWNAELSDDELIINEQTASLLGVVVGDTVTVAAGPERKLFRIAVVAEERGLTGFRDSGGYNGTVIASENAVRMLTGKTEGRYDAILAGTDNPNYPAYGFPLPLEVKYSLVFLKNDYQNRISQMNLTLLIGLISIVAIISSLLFMRQVLVMIGESRQEIYGILRAIGFSKGNISAMFFVEAFLLSLCSAVVGTLFGLAAGYGAVAWLYGGYAEELARMTGENIPISPYVSVAGIAIVFGVVFLFLAVISLLAARKAGKVRMVEALRGPTSESDTPRSRWRKIITVIGAGAGLGAVGVHFYQAFVETPDLMGPEPPLLFALCWIVACCVLLFIAIYLLGVVQRPLMRLLQTLKLPQLSIMLAAKYPRKHIGRTYTAALLFALVMMTITFTASMLQTVLTNFDSERNPQSIYGYGGYASYRTPEERAKIETTAAADPFLQERIKGTFTVEPFMLSIQKNGIASAIVSVTEELMKDGGYELFGRSPEFATDEEAWRAVQNNPQYIILPYYYTTTDKFSHGNTTPMEAGQSITLPVYENKLRGPSDPYEPVMSKPFTIAGFSTPYSADPGSNYFYGAAYMHPSVVQEVKPYGYKWPQHTDLGFVLFDFDYENIALSQELEERFAILGMMTFKVPYLNNQATMLTSKQIGNGFIGFTVISACIGLLGLAVIQFRAVRERSHQIAMMRCIGIPGKHIYWMFFIEGFFISAIGLLVGWAIGTSGSRIVTESISSNVRAYEQPIDIAYPIILLSVILLGLLAASLLINIAPSRSALRLKAADALRMGNE